MNKPASGIIRSDNSKALLLIGGDDRLEFREPRQAIRILARGRGIEPIETSTSRAFDA